MPTPFMSAVIAAVLVLSLAGPGSGDARADDAARISRLESEIQQLRIRIDEQLRRIERLEQELEARGNQPAIGALTGGRADLPAARATGPLPWHSPQAWDRLAAGMSEAEVTGILGEPTAVEMLESFKTLFYRGAVPGAGTLAGHVNFRDDRMVAVSRPAFAN